MGARNIKQKYHTRLFNIRKKRKIQNSVGVLKYMEL